MTRSTSAVLAIVALAVIALANRTAALSTGAPSMACINMRPLHGLNQPRPASSSQFFVRQSALSYAPGQNVTVEIMTQSSERHFRGFMIQSYNPVDGKQLGRFVANEHAQPMSCASATHRNHQDKTLVSITWTPPETGATLVATDQASQPNLGALGNWLGLNSGLQKRHLPTPTPPAKPAQPLQQVRFRATIVVSYSEFYTGFESSELSFDRFDYSPASQSRARGIVNVAVAVSPRANTTAIAVAGSGGGGGNGLPEEPRGPPTVGANSSPSSSSYSNPHSNPGFERASAPVDRPH